VTAQETLRREIAQQLHGSVQNRLIFLVLKLKELQKTAPPGDLSSGLAELTTQFEELLENEIRSFSHQLYPYILRRGLIPALQSLGDRFEEAMAVDLEFDRELMQRERTNPGAIPEVVRLAGYRIAEEALTNSLKHANARRVTVKLETMAGGWLSLIVRDDGPGLIDEGNGAGMGIVGMRDYAEVMGGACHFQNAPGGGMEVRAILSLSEPDGPPPD
jgi:two-component system sensor histidine kinase UhpB